MREEEPSVLPSGRRLDGERGWSLISIQLVTPRVVFFFFVTGHFSARSKIFLCAAKSRVLQARWPSCSRGDGDGVEGERERSLRPELGSEVQRKFPRVECASSSRAPAGERDGGEASDG